MIDLPKQDRSRAIDLLIATLAIICVLLLIMVFARPQEVNAVRTAEREMAHNDAGAILPITTERLRSKVVPKALKPQARQEESAFSAEAFQKEIATINVAKTKLANTPQSQGVSERITQPEPLSWHAQQELLKIVSGE